MTIIYFILILGITVMIHEFGHFIFAKKAGIHVFEFSIGMGPCIKSWHRKGDETTYSVRLFPIGGFVSMAGEDNEDEEDVPKDELLQSKTWGQRFMTIIAGIMMNFILAISIFFLIALFHGGTSFYGYISSIEKGMPADNKVLKQGDKILKLNNKTISSDSLLLELMVNNGKKINLTVEHEDGKVESIKMNPKKNKDGEYKYGFVLGTKEEKGFVNAVKYAFVKTYSLLDQLCRTIGHLVTGRLSLKNLSGPVGIYEVVGETAKTGFTNLVFLLGYLSLNVGFMNLLPIPAFDGGRLLFLIIEKIKRSPVNPKVENNIHAVGMVLLMIMMVLVTYNDIVRIFF